MGGVNEVRVQLILSNNGDEDAIVLLLNISHSVKDVFTDQMEITINVCMAMVYDAHNYTHTYSSDTPEYLSGFLYIGGGGGPLKSSNRSGDYPFPPELSPFLQRNNAYACLR